MIKKLLTDLRKNLRTKIDPAYKQGSINFYKEPVKLYGVRANKLKMIASQHYQQIKNWPLNKQLKIIEELFKSNFNEEFYIGANWLYRLKHRLTVKHFKLLERWLKKYVTNWSMCDDYCTHALGHLIYRYPRLIKRAKNWTKSKSRWVKRASAVLHIQPTKKASATHQQIIKNRKKYLANIFNISDQLMTDADDLVQKGYGWLLKEASNLFSRDIYNYVLKNKQKMPRTALRYAVEKLPKAWKTKALKKN